ncbi:MAG: mono/diheme cytochrome c family protein [Verrucomicrobiales bacterium]|jgi:mono/diheme cytochrome c family protein
MIRQRTSAIGVGIFILLLASSASAVDYEKDIKPIFKEHCIDCHGPDKQKSELRVDLRALLLRGGDSGIASIVPGNAMKSHLLDLVKGTDPDEIMPPKGEPLSSGQVALLEQWIVEGAEWPGQMDAVAELTTDHWSLLPVVRPEVPRNGANHPIDAFLNAGLEEAKLQANGAADARSLVRRASIVLTGFPPTPDRVKEFVTAFSADADVAYNALVDELLASPHFGERWAQHWLDVIRWAETNGSEANLYRKNAWIYRDYVIRAFNDDLPYNQFVKEQLAGDQLGAGEATGFLVAGPHVPAATVGREPTAIRQARADRMDEVIQTVGASMLGVTVGCARCHNHKFDPISIKDYYSLTAVFQGVEFGGRWPEFSDDHPRRKRAKELYVEISKERKALREGAGQWVENWGGCQDLTFPTTNTKALRVEFTARNIGIDELDVYGPTDYYKNRALASVGTKLVTGDAITKKGNWVENANDGEVGTMAWRTDLPKDSKQKPWIEIHFAAEQEVNRFRFSTNREYYFETDYLEMNDPYFSGYKISALQQDGTWQEVGKTGWAMALLNKNPQLKKSSEHLQILISQLSEEGPRHSFVGKFTEPAVTKVLLRGSPENPRDEVPPAGFDIMGGDLGLNSKTPEAKRRLRYAEWLTQPDHPLTSRVIVNRIWHHVFGTGIVPTSSDFGKAGALPTHPELLDWLASEFVQPTQRPDGKPWSMKGLIRMLVTSDAFRRSSLPDQAGLLADAGSSLLWRFPPQRVEAEVIRDGILQSSGKLDTSIGGRSFRIHNVKKTYAQWQVVNNHGPDTWRRMIYQERMRRVDDKMFTAFDFPDCGQVKPKRPVSTTPLQALNLMNSDFVVEQSKFVAERAVMEAGADPTAQVARAFELLLGRLPEADEVAACEGIELPLICRSLINSNEFAFLP